MQTQQQVVYTTGTPNGATVITVQSPPATPASRVFLERIEFDLSALRSLGSLQIFMALISFGAATMAIIVYAAYWFVCDGYWCGAFFMASGSAAVHAVRFSTRRTILKARGLALMSLAMAAVQFGVSLGGLIYNIDTQYFYKTYYSCWWSVCGYYWYNYPEMEAANGMLVGAASLQMIFSIAQLSICIRALKYGKVKRVAQTANALTLNNQPGAAVITINNAAPQPVQPYPYQQPTGVSPSYSGVMESPPAYQPPYPSAPYDTIPYGSK